MSIRAEDRYAIDVLTSGSVKPLRARGQWRGGHVVGEEGHGDLTFERDAGVSHIADDIVNHLTINGSDSDESNCTVVHSEGTATPALSRAPSYQDGKHASEDDHR